MRQGKAPPERAGWQPLACGVYVGAGALFRASAACRHALCPCPPVQSEGVRAHRRDDGVLSLHSTGQGSGHSSHSAAHCGNQQAIKSSYHTLHLGRSNSAAAADTPSLTFLARVVPALFAHGPISHPPLPSPTRLLLTPILKCVTPPSAQPRRKDPGKDGDDHKPGLPRHHPTAQHQRS